MRVTATLLQPQPIVLKNIDDSEVTLPIGLAENAIGGRTTRSGTRSGL